MLKIGIIGCGTIAKKHISFIRQIPNAEVTAISDPIEPNLTAIGDKYKIGARFSDFRQMITTNALDVVHVLTPPNFHVEIAQYALNHGIHAYIEKPFTLSSEEASAIIDLAQRRNLLICPGYNHLFDPCMQKADALIRQGLIGSLLHIESHYGMNVNRSDLRSTTSDNKIPWPYQLPGGLLNNYIDHPLYLINHYLGPAIISGMTCLSRGVLPQQLTDELRVSFQNDSGSAQLVISFNENPKMHFLKVFGTKGFIFVNFDTMTTLYHKSDSLLPKAAQKATFNLSEANQLIFSTINNVIGLISKKLQPYQGMKNLISNFYTSVRSDGKSPIAPDLILTTENLKDQIWRQSKGTHLDFNPILKSVKKSSDKPFILVTGASGFLGVKTVEALLAKGFRVRCLVRKLSRIDKLIDLDTEIFFGDIRDRPSLSDAMKGIDQVVHLAADTSGNANTSHDITLSGTRNVLELALDYGIKKLIYISSMSVYGSVHIPENETVSENGLLEPFPARRGAYAASKHAAEDLVREYLSDPRIAVTILRPAMFFGRGGDMFFGPIGGRLGSLAVIAFGNPHQKLRLVSVQDVAKAIALALEKPSSRGKIYNIVHDETITKYDYLTRHYLNYAGIHHLVFIPDVFLRLIIAAQTMLFTILKRQPILTLYRYTASQRQINFSNMSIKSDLNWKPEDHLEAQIKAALNP